MKFLLLLLPLFLLGLVIFGPLLESGRAGALRARAVTARLRVLTWLTAGAMVGGLLFLPDKGRVLLTLLPLYGLLAGVQAWWRRFPAGASKVDVETMKRARPARGAAENKVR